MLPPPSAITQPARRRGRTSAWLPGAIGLALVALWGLLAIAALVHAAPIESAYRTALTAMPDPDPLADPPLDVAIAQLRVGVMLVVALPVAIAAATLGLVAVLLHRGHGSALLPSWLALGFGALSALPSLGALVAGIAMCLFNGLVVFG